MRHGFYNSYEVNPKVEIGKYCETEDFVDPLEAHALRADGIVEDIKENAFYLFQEDWEQLCVDEKTTPPIGFVFLIKIEGGIRATQTEPHMTTIARS
jgi:hypothetical protein